MERYNYKNISQFIGEKVQLRDEQGNVAELSIADVCKGAMDGDEWEAFSVIYQGNKDFFVPQGTYFFTSEHFGEKQLFLSPKSDIEYETVVTRRRTEEA